MGIKEATQKIFKRIRKKLSGKNDVHSLRNALRVLREIAKAQPQQAARVFETVKLALQSKKNDGVSLNEVYIVLSEIAAVQPQLAVQVLNTFKIGLQSENNSCSSLCKAYNVLGEIAKVQPQLAEQIFEIYKLGLQSEENNCDSLSNAYCSLSPIVDAQPQLAEQVLEVYKLGSLSEKNNGESLAYAYSHLGYIAEARPQLAEQVIEMVKLGLQSENNNDTLCRAYYTLGEIAKAQPQLVEQVFEAYKLGLQSGGNIAYSLRYAYETLDKIAEAHPQLAEQVIEMVKLGLQSEKNSSSSLRKAYDVLYDIVKAHPQLAEQVFEALQIGLQSEKNDGDSLSRAYFNLNLLKITEAQPQLAEQVFEMVKLGLQSEKNHANTLRQAYTALRDIVKVRPQLAKQVFEMFKLGLQSKENDGTTLGNAYRSLCAIAEVHPQLVGQVFETFKLGLRSVKNDYSSLSNAYSVLGYIVTAQPELSSKVLITLKMAMQSENKDDRNFDIAAYFALRFCMRNLPLTETIAQHPEIEKEIQIIHKGRFSTDDEFEYALNNLNKKELLDSNVFRAQQHVMNILVSTSAQESGIVKEDAEAFRRPDASKKVKKYVESNQAWLIPASFKGAVVFKSYFPSYVQTILNHNRKNPEDALSIHDAVYWLPEPMTSEANERFSQFIRKNIIYQNAEHKMVHRPLSELKIIAQNWKALENKLQELGDDSELAKLKYNDILSVCMSVKYGDQRHDGFAIEAAKHGVSEKNYRKCEDIYLAGLKVPEPFDSKKEFKVGKYTGKFLPRDDVRTGFFGDYTDCCQQFGGVGDSCAVSTVKHPFSQLFVIEDERGKIIAGSWTWENTEGKYREVCFDNIEALGELQERPEINKIYEQVGKYLTQEQNCRRVTIGLSHQDADISQYEETKAIPLPELYGKDGTNSYSDARSQVLLAENPNAEPLDKTKETQRYIRDVCFLDKKAMSRVSSEVFPNGDRKLQIPENMAGFVIEDREKGVVGYCLYDKEEKSIYDMAVLPEYRTDKNASSKKLFAEMMRTITQEGGEWSAEMRDKTTLKYLEIMAERGLVKFEKHGVDHVMSDGSQVVAVTFTPIRRDVVNATAHAKSKIQPQTENTAATIPLRPNNQSTPPRFTGRNSDENTA